MASGTQPTSPPPGAPALVTGDDARFHRLDPCYLFFCYLDPKAFQLMHRARRGWVAMLKKAVRLGSQPINVNWM